MQTATPPQPQISAFDFFRIALGYWGRSKRTGAWTLTFFLLAAMAAQLAAQVAMNAWNRLFFDALERREAADVWATIGWLPLIVAALAGAVTSLLVARMLLQARWREWLTDRIAGWWIADQRYYRLGLLAPEFAAPEYRIAEDVRLSVEPLVEFVVGILSATITALAFAAILWRVAGSAEVTLGGVTVVIPAYMALAAILYAVIASVAAYLAGRPLVKRVAAKNEAEARLRADMTRLRENSESIALIRGDADELANIRRTYADVIRAWLAVIRQQGVLGVVLNTNGALFPIVPLVLITPKYLSGDITLGGLMQVVAAFTAVQGALVWFVDNSVRLAEWFASATRVLELTNALDELDVATQMDGQGELRIEESEGDDIRLESLSIADKAGRTVIGDSSIVIARGEKVLVVGESGAGKSTLIRAIAGLWPWGSGVIRLPRDQRVAFVPQRPYMPLGTLREAICYPAAAGDISQDAVAAAMTRCSLDTLIKRLDEPNVRWDQVLSGGERQRLAFCRLLLQKPEIIIMDEATSALDEKSQTSLLSLFREDLAGSTVISVGHRPEIEAFHDRKIELERRVAGARMRHSPIVKSVWRTIVERLRAGD